MTAIRRSLPLAWGVACLGYVVLVSLGHLAAGEAERIASTALQALGLYALAWIRLPRRAFVAAALVLLGALVGVAIVERATAARTWRSADATLVDTVADLRIPTRVAGDEGAPRWRDWSLAGGEGTLDLTLGLELRRLDGRTGWDWRTPTQGDALSPVTADGETWTRFVPEGDGAFIYRRADVGDPAAGRTFRARVELRSTAGTACGAVHLGASGAGADRARRDVCVSEAWRTVDLTWRAPPRSSSRTVDVIVNRFRDAIVEIRRVRIEERAHDAWVPLGPLAPTGVAIALILPDGNGPGRTVAHAQVDPGAAWRSVELRAGDVDAADANDVRASMEVERGVVVEVRSTTLAATGAEVPAVRPTSRLSRQDLGFPHFNLAGHTLATTAVAALVLSRRTAVSLALAGLAVIAVYVTGSRTAMVGLLAGLVLLLLLPTGRRRAQRVAVAVVLASIVVATAFAPELLGRFAIWSSDNVNEVSRREIWSTAWQAFLEHPWSGIGKDPGAFQAFWRERAGALAGRVAPAHGHDFWLDHAARLGLPGVAAAAWLTAWIVALSWRTRRWAGLAIALPVLAMQVTDTTLLYVGVVVPAVLAHRVVDEGRAGR